MPIGGITTGQLYLGGGDGRLWHWDIFNPKTTPTEQPGASHYTNPLLAPWHVSDQGFTLRVIGCDPMTVPINSEGFSDVSFKGSIPPDSMSYRDGVLTGRRSGRTPLCR